MGFANAFIELTVSLSTGHFLGKVLIIKVMFDGAVRLVDCSVSYRLSYPMNMSSYDWGFMSEPELFLGGRRLTCPRGKMIGG